MAGGTVPASAGLDNSASANSGAPPGSGPHGDGNGRQLVRSLVLKAACLVGGAYLLKRLTKTTTRLDHSRIVAQSLSGEKFSSEQAAQDPMTYFNLRMLACPATVLADGARVLYFEQAFWRTPERPYRQRFLMVKPCSKETKCDVEVASYAVRDIEEYRNFCDRGKNQRPQQVEVVGTFPTRNFTYGNFKEKILERIVNLSGFFLFEDMAEHLTTVYLAKCERGRRCLYEGSTPPGGFPNSWNGATRCTSEMTIFKGGEIHSWDRAYDDEGNQVWGVRQGPYEFKQGHSNTSGLVSESDFASTLLKEDKTLSTFSS